MTLIVVAIVTLLLGVAYASFFEWTLHRYVMHRPLGFFRYPFEAHAFTHHRIFRADDSYHCTDVRNQGKIPMAWWNGPVIVLLGSIPFYMGALPFVFTGFSAIAWIIIGIGFGVSSSYYGAYEYLHWCMHLPKARRLEKSRLFRRLNGHHLLHHRFPSTNYNVVLPLADVVCRTLLSRSKISFKQARGPSVPNVQPHSVT